MASVLGIWSWWWGTITTMFGNKLLDTIILLCFTFLAIFLPFLITKKLKNTSLPLPPGPRGLPIVGYLPFLGTNLHTKFTQLANIYGQIYKFWLGNKICIVLNSPEVVKEVVRDQDAVFANRDVPIASLIATYGGNDIAISPYNPEWRKLRKIFVREMLGNKSLDACYGLRKQEVQMSIKQLYGKIGTPVNVCQVSLVTSVNVVISMVWGGRIEGDEEEKDLQEMLTELMVLQGLPNVSDIFPVLARFDLQGIQGKMRKVIDGFDQILNCVIEQRMSMVGAMEKGEGKNEQRKDFLQYLLELKENQDSSSSISLTQIKAMLMDIVVGATDTTSTMVVWTMAELMLHPEIMQKVLKELTEVVGLTNAVEESHLPKLNYLEAVVKEALCLHPAVPLLVPRMPSQTTNVGGYTIPKGSKIFINAWAIHRDPKLWNSPLEFRPERFLNGTNEWDFSGNNFQYIPFGSGRRICAGLPLAERMLMYLLASLLHSFEWTLPEGAEPDMEGQFGIVLKKLMPLVAIPTSRLSNLEIYA